MLAYRVIGLPLHALDGRGAAAAAGTLRCQYPDVLCLAPSYSQHNLSPEFRWATHLEHWHAGSPGSSLSLDFYASYNVLLNIVLLLASVAVGLVIFLRRFETRIALLAAFTLVLVPIACHTTNL